MLAFLAGPVLVAALAASSVPSVPSPPTASEAPLLDLATLYVNRGGRLELSPAVRALAGHTVRVRGFMIELEEPARGAFYVARTPITGDESGGGTGDVPVNSILVRVPGFEGAEVPWRPGLFELRGQLEVGRVEDADGRASLVRLVLAEERTP